MIQSSLLQSIPHIRHGFAAIRNIPRRVKLPRQVHGTHIIDMQSAVRPEADGVYVQTPGSMIGVYTADCVPVLMTDVQTGMIAAIHAGWRGTRGGIVQRGVETFVHCGSARRDLRISIGPAIKSCCYDVSEMRARLVSQQYGSDAIRYVGHKLYIDLQTINRNQVIACGIDPGHVEIVPVCTYCSPDGLCSYRRGDRNIRMVSYIERL